MIRYLPVLLDLVLMVVAIVDIILIDGSRVRGLPKFAWISLCVIVPIVGAVLWFVVGRERLEPREHGRLRDAPSSPPRRSGPLAPDDDPQFLGQLSREAQQEERIRELEKRLAELDDDKPKD